MAIFRIASGVIGLFCVLGVSPLQGQESWVHPDAVRQPTVWGTWLRGLEVINGRIYVGYGDASANTGPINVRYFDPAAETFSDSLITARTEAIDTYRQFGDTVFAIHTDPLGTSFGGFVSGPADLSGSWRENNSMDLEHAFGITSYGASSNLFITGSGGGFARQNSRVWNSNDGGLSWHVELELPPADDWSYSGPGDTTDGYARFYGAGVLNGQLWVNQITEKWIGDGNGNLVTFLGLESHSFFHDGSTWTAGPEMVDLDGSVNSFIEPFLFSDKLVSIGENNRLFVFDGVDSEYIRLDNGAGENSSFTNHMVYGDRLYAMRLDDWTIVSTRDLVNWDLVLQAPAGAAHFTIFDRDIYLGGFNGVLYRYQNAVPALSGDYNSDGIVDAADYTVWRDHLGQAFDLPGENPDADTPGMVDAEDFMFWKSQFGQSSGSGSVASVNATVPEPTTLVLLMMAVVVFGTSRRALRR